MKIGIANDHTGIEMKMGITKYLEDMGHKVINYGTDETQSTSYVTWGEKVANEVASGNLDLGIAICGTGLGIGLVCNKVPGIRACICSEPYTARYSRLHNNCNMLTFGARVVGIEMAKMIVHEFVTTEFEGGRHAERVNQMMEVEKKHLK